MNNAPWVCPRCEKVNAPWMPQCFCQPVAAKGHGRIFTLRRAAGACLKSKSTILRAIQNGKLPAKLDANNHYQIMESDLRELYEVHA